MTKLGYNCHCIESGEEAIKHLRDNEYDLLILDMIMPPGIDGAETFAEASKINPRQRAIIVSGYAESERVRDAMQLGAGAFVRKPMTLKTIAIAVRKELDRKDEVHN